jgi:glycogen debranching enzyme
MSKWYHSSGKWEWRSCSVLSFDNEKRKFLIEWDDSSKQKYVNRLNLKFDEEDEKLFEKRIQAATQHRLLSEAMLVCS